MNKVRRLLYPASVEDVLIGGLLIITTLTMAAAGLVAWVSP